MARKEKKEIRIVIHGTTYCPNFGDVLFARMFYQACQRIPDAQVDFVQIPFFNVCDFVRKAAGYDRHTGPLAFLKADAMVLMSGGYLGLDISDHYHALRNYYRAILPGRLFQLLGKPVYIVGIGGGSLGVKWFRHSVARLVNQAKMITVRDETTKRFLVEYGCSPDIPVTADTALSYDTAQIQPVRDPRFHTLLDGSRILFLHVNSPGSKDDVRIAETIVPALNVFLGEHPEYGVVLGHDYEISGRIEDTQCWAKLQCAKKYAFDYHSIDDMLSILRSVDTVITPKLHVGILGSLLEKSVLSFTIDKEKTLAFFKQIGYPERCIPFAGLTTEKVADQLRRYHDQPVHIPQEILDLAKTNLLFVNDIEREFRGNGQKD